MLGFLIPTILTTCTFLGIFTFLNMNPNILSKYVTAPDATPTIKEPIISIIQEDFIVAPKSKDITTKDSDRDIFEIDTVFQKSENPEESNEPSINQQLEHDKLIQSSQEPSSTTNEDSESSSEESSNESSSSEAEVNESTGNPVLSSEPAMTVENPIINNLSSRMDIVRKERKIAKKIAQKFRYLKDEEAEDLLKLILLGEGSKNFFIFLYNEVKGVKGVIGYDKSFLCSSLIEFIVKLYTKDLTSAGDVSKDDVTSKYTHLFEMYNL